MKNIKFSFMLILTFALSCQAPESDLANTLDYELKVIEYQTPDCEPEHDPCFLATITYPQFNNGDSMAVRLANRIIRNSTLDFIGMGDVEAVTDPTLEDAVHDLSGSFQRFRSDFPASSIGWEARIKSQEIARNDTILVFETNAMTYFGGAHPNKNLRYFNFNRHTGSLVPLSAFISDMETFTARAEKTFRSKYLKADQTFEDAGFSFMGEDFMLPANYAFYQDSIKLHYNHYEIASYASGDFDIMVSIQ
jgi:hypothetical protein